MSQRPPRLYLHRHEGPRPALVALHSTALHGGQWRHLARDLNGQRLLLAPDLLGYGHNPTWEGDAFHWEQDLEAVLAVLEDQGEPCDLLGHSYGGFLAVQAALRAPERVRRLAVYEPVLWGLLQDALEEPQAQAYLAMLDNDWMLNQALAGSEAWMEHFLNFWGSPGSFGRLPQARKAQMMRSARKTFFEVNATAQDKNTRVADVARLQVPLLVMSGRQSPGSIQLVARLLAQAASDAQSVQVDAGHMAPVTDAGLVNPHLLSFFELAAR